VLQIFYIQKSEKKEDSQEPQKKDRTAEKHEETERKPSAAPVLAPWQGKETGASLPQEKLGSHDKLANLAVDKPIPPCEP
jgi:hypothetical protein